MHKITKLKLTIILTGALDLFSNAPIVLKKPKYSLVQQIKRKLVGFNYTEVITPNHQIPGLVGAIPQELIVIIEQLQKHPGNIQLNRLLLHGPPGNGKTTIARKISEIINANFLYQAAPSIVSKYIGSAAENIDEKFKEAETLIKETGKPVIIFIDEIDAIANDYKSKSEFRSEHENALKQLWLCMDKHKNNSNIFVICATNEFKRINKTFLDRFGSNTIEIKNPDKETREKVFKHYFEKNNINLEDKFLEYLVKISNNVSIRAIEDIIKSAVQDMDKLTSERVELLLNKSKSKMKYAADHSAIADAASKINNVLHAPILLHQLLAILLPVIGYELKRR
jgi:SpoVK/Ycf46/Vps4 family AAA+-type ATPase